MNIKIFEKEFDQLKRDVVFIKSEIVEIKSLLLDIQPYLSPKIKKNSQGRSVTSSEAPEPKRIRLVGISTNDKQAPVSGVRIKIYDGTNNNMVFETVSDETGKWNAFVNRPGSYSIEMKRSGMVNKNFNITVPQGASTLQLGKGR